MTEDKPFAQRWEEHQQRWDEYQPSKSLWLWSCMGSALLPVFIGFFAGGWMTGNAVEEMAARAALAARAELVADICARNFAEGRDFEVRFARLKGADEPTRSSMLQEGGWVTLAGMDEPLAAAASICADKLANTMRPSVNGLTSAYDPSG